jgi:hypothetical protein
MARQIRMRAVALAVGRLTISRSQESEEVVMTAA